MPRGRPSRHGDLDSAEARATSSMAVDGIGPAARPAPPPARTAHGARHGRRPGAAAGRQDRLEQPVSSSSVGRRSHLRSVRPRLDVGQEDAAHLEQPDVVDAPAARCEPASAAAPAATSCAGRALRRTVGWRSGWPGAGRRQRQPERVPVAVTDERVVLTSTSRMPPAPGRCGAAALCGGSALRPAGAAGSTLGTLS